MKLDQQQQDFVTLQSTLELLSDSCFPDTCTVHTPREREGEMVAMDHNNVSFFFASTGM